jgi:hypothetical protein
MLSWLFAASKTRAEGDNWIFGTAGKYVPEKAIVAFALNACVWVAGVTYP